MSEKFEAFKAALHALCMEHGVRLYGGTDYDDPSVYAEEVGDAAAGCELDIVDLIPLTPEEIAEAEARRAADEAEWRAKWDAKWGGSHMKKHFALLDSMSLEEKRAMIAANAEKQRTKHMRVTRIPGDHNDIGDKPCRVYLNGVEILDWTVADDFRRVVETPEGARFGAVRIDMAGAATVAEPEPAQIPSNSLSGMFVFTPDPKPAAPAIEVVEAPAPAPVAAPAAPTYAAPKVAVSPAAAKKKRGR